MTTSWQLGSPVSLNRYGYGNGSPLRFADPDGRVAIDSVDQRAWQGSRRTAADRATDAAFAKTMRLVRRARAHGIDPNRFTAERGERSLRWAVARATVAQRCAPACDWGGRGEWGFGLDNVTEVLKHTVNAGAGVTDAVLSVLEDSVNTVVFAAEGLAQAGQMVRHRGNVHSDDLIRLRRFEAGRFGPVFKDRYSLMAYDISHDVTRNAIIAASLASAAPAAGSRMLQAGRSIKGLVGALRPASRGAKQSRGVAAKASPSGPDLLGRAADDIVSGDLTVAGRALAKHGDRAGSAFPAPTGSQAAISSQARKIVQDILRNEVRRVEFYNPRLKMQVVDIYEATGRGIRFSKPGEFIGFLEP